MADNDELGKRWATVAGAGFALGLVATGALALPLYGVLPGVYVPGWSTWPAFVVPLGFAVAGVATVATGLLAGAPARHASLAGAASGAIGGNLAFAALGAPALGVYAAAPLWAAAPATGDAGIAVLAEGTTTVILVQWLGSLAFVGGFAALGALGGTLATITRDDEPVPLDAAPLAHLASPAVAGAIATAIVGVAIGSSFAPLAASTWDKLAHHPAQALTPIAFGVAPALLTTLAFGACAVAGGVAAAQQARFDGARSGMWYTAGALLLAALGMFAGLALTGGLRGAWGLAAVASVGAAVLALWLGVGHGERHRRSGELEPESLYQSIGAGLTDAALIMNPLVVASIHAGLVTALAVVPWIDSFNTGSAPPDIATTVATLYDVSIRWVAFGVFAAAPVTALFHIAVAALARARRRQVATG